MLSRGKLPRVPSGLAGQPISTCPEELRSTPSASGRKEPVVESEIGKMPVLRVTASIVVTAMKPRPSTARSVEFAVPISGPRSSINRIEVDLTPPAE